MSSKSAPPPHLKLVAVGDGAVGKTSLLMSFAKNEFPEKYIPTVFDNTIAMLSVDGKTYELELWDTAGQEDYDRLRPLSYPDSNLVFVVFSLENAESLKSVENKWVKEVREHTKAPIVLVGTKMDMRDDNSPAHVPTAKAQEMATRVQAAAYIETSAKMRINVNLVFEEAVRTLFPQAAQPQGCSCVLL